MTCPTLVDAIVKALRSAGATEEIIAAAVGAAGAFQNAPRPREGSHASMPITRRKTCDETPAPCDETCDETPVPRDVSRPPSLRACAAPWSAALLIGGRSTARGMRRARAAPLVLAQLSQLPKTPRQLATAVAS
jgi:hypothetical protein